jgi:hypothetical protein
MFSLFSIFNFYFTIPPSSSSFSSSSSSTTNTTAIALKYHPKYEKRKQKPQQNEQIAIKKLNEHEKRD